MPPLSGKHTATPVALHCTCHRILNTRSALNAQCATKMLYEDANACIRSMADRVYKGLHECGTLTLKISWYKSGQYRWGAGRGGARCGRCATSASLRAPAWCALTPGMAQLSTALMQRYSGADTSSRYPLLDALGMPPGKIVTNSKSVYVPPH